MHADILLGKVLPAQCSRLLSQCSGKLEFLHAKSVLQSSESPTGSVSASRTPASQELGRGNTKCMQTTYWGSCSQHSAQGSSHSAQEPWSSCMQSLCSSSESSSSLDSVNTSGTSQSQELGVGYHLKVPSVRFSHLLGQCPAWWTRGHQGAGKLHASGN